MSNFDRSTIEHMLRIGNRMETLRETLFDCEEQVMHRLGVEYRAGIVGQSEVGDILHEVRHLLAPGWMKRCEVALGFPVRKLMSSRAQKTANEAMYGQNEAWGWSGSCSMEWTDDGRPLERTVSWPRPMKGVSVVYLLHSVFGDPLYVGSTHDFSARIKSHLLDGKPAAFWSAYLCANREEAYVLEDRLLKENMPTMNKRRGR